MDPRELETMEAAAEQYYKTSGWVPTEWAVMNFKAGWKAASERKDVTQYINRIDQLGQLIRERDNKIQSLQSKLATAVEALDKIADTQDIAPMDAEGSGPCRIRLAETRNRRILEARKALAKIKGDVK